jgi:glucosylceramidase
MALISLRAGLLAGATGSLLLLASGFRPLGPQRTAGNEPVAVWMTSGDQTYLLQQLTSVAFGATAAAAPITITLDEQTSYQTIDGFGAAMTGSAAYLLNRRMSAAQRDALLTELYTSSGLGLNLVRHSMGASDFSVQGDFTYDDLASGATDPTLASFSLAYDEVDLIPMLQAARAKNSRLKIFGSPWTAPAWMKQTRTLRGSFLAAASYQTYANYFVRYVQGYAAHGLPIYAVTLQNEPLNTTTDYPAMRMDPVNQIDFLKNNIGPAFATAGLNTKLIVYDHNWDRPDYPNAVFADPLAAQYAAGATFHCYGGSVGQQSTTRNAYPGKDLWFTECSGTAGSSFAGDLKWNTSNIIIGATRNWAKGSILWNLALNPANGPTNGGCTTCRGVLTIDENTGAVTRNVEYYVLGHASKFVHEGAVRIGSSSTAGVIETVAFRNTDSTRVLIALNNSNTTRTFRVDWRGQFFTYTLTAGAVATYTWAPAGSTLATSKSAADRRLQMYPTVAGGELTLEYTSLTSQQLTTELVDATGRVVLRPAPLAVHPGLNKLMLNVGSVAPGAYVLRVFTPEGPLSRRVSIVR